MNEDLFINSEAGKETFIKPKVKQSRHERPFSLYSKPTNDTDLTKVIIPYSFEEKRYIIPQKNIEFYDKKEYLVEKVNEFNNISSFQMDIQYKASCGQQIGMYLPCMVVLIIGLYLLILLLAFFSFNPVLIYICFQMGKYLYKTLKTIRAVFFDKFRVNDIKSVLDEENMMEFCRQNNLQWCLGQSGYWLELEKLI